MQVKPILLLFFKYITNHRKTYSNIKKVHAATTKPTMIESLLFLKLILWIKLLMIGNLFEISLNLVCSLFKVCL